MLKSCLLALFVLFNFCFAKAQDFSNKGIDFWVGYGYHQSMTLSSNPQDMVLYFTSDEAANVQVEIPGVGWVKNYQVSANSVTESDPMPKSGSQDTRLFSEGLYNTGIHITSDKPIVAYAHIYSTSVSGASLLFPVNTLGQDYYSLNFTQKSNAASSNSWAFVVSTEDNTAVEITPSANTLTHLAGIPFTVSLNRGEIYNILGETTGNTGVDLTGTRIRSVSTGITGCKRIAVFSGSGRSSISCNTDNTVSSSDNLFQEVFPKNAWGKKYLTVPTSKLTNNYFRIAVGDPSTIVSVNGIVATNLINGFYYEILANTPQSIVSDKPVMVAQYITSSTACGNSDNNNGDPEMIYLSPVEQTIDKVTLNSTKHYNITSNFINVIIKSSDINSFTLDGSASPSSFITHPADPAYSYAVFPVATGAHSLKANGGFNAIAYGYGIQESYGYNAGTNIKDLNQFITVSNPYASVNFGATCGNTPFSLSLTLPYQPNSLVWDFNNNASLSPSQTITNNSPVADSAYVLDGRNLYRYKLPGTFMFNANGTFPLTVTADNQSTDGCNGQQQLSFNIAVSTKPTASFSFTYKGCASDSVLFLNASTDPISPVSKWNWNFGDGTTDTLSNPSKAYQTFGTYNVKLTSVNSIGCYSDTTKSITIASPPVATFGFSQTNCADSSVIFYDSSTISAGTINKWDWDFGNGNILSNSTNANVSNIYKAAGTYTVSLQVENSSGCKSAVFKKDIIIHSKPVADFSMPGVCLPLGIANFSNLSSISDSATDALTYIWNFGDGGTSAQKNPVYTYKTAGPFSVNLTATSAFGCRADTTKIVSNVFARPHADFTFNANKNCLSDSIYFTDNSSAAGNTIKAWFWNFGDGSTSNFQNPAKKYAAPGSYTVTLYISSNAGCISDTATNTIIKNKPPTASFNVSQANCEKQPVTITINPSDNSVPLTAWNWDFGNGQTTSTQGGTFTITYNNAGNYLIKLVVETAEGCKSDTIAQPVIVQSSPVTNFLLPVICVNDAFATFTDSSFVAENTAGSLTYLWNFGDPNSSDNTSVSQNPKHHYAAPGFYNVSLTTTSGAGCLSALTKPFTVNGVPKADFSIVDSLELCSNKSVQIQNSSSVSPGSISKIEIIWDSKNASLFIDSDHAPVQGKIYAHTYPVTNKAMTYQIKLKAYSGINCFDEKTMTVLINAAPKVIFSPVSSICFNNSTRTISTAAETSGLAGSAIFSGNGISPAGVFDPKQAGAGPSVITYKFTTAEGCADSALQTITVLQNPMVTLPPKIFVLEGGSVVANPVITGNVSKYLWSPPTWLDNPEIQKPTITPLADISYGLTVTSYDGCAGFGNVLVSVLKSLAIPNAFSPNGDGINDTWNIPSLASYPDCKVEIFNRYGNLVFNSTGYQKPWDGFYKGNILPVAVYYYIINVGNGKKPYSGTITILK